MWTAHIFPSHIKMGRLHLSSEAMARCTGGPDVILQRSAEALARHRRFRLETDSFRSENGASEISTVLMHPWRTNMARLRLSTGLMAHCTQAPDAISQRGPEN